MNKTERINALISKGTFKETDRAWLQNTPEEGLAALEARAETPAPQPPAAPAPTQTPAAPAPTPTQAPATPPPATPSAEDIVKAAMANLSLDQLIAMAPASLQTELRASKEARDAQRNAAVLLIKAAGARNTFSDAELNAMELTQLQKLAQLVGGQPAASRIVDFAARGLPRAASAAGAGDSGSDGEEIEAPPSLVDSIVAARTAVTK